MFKVETDRPSIPQHFGLVWALVTSIGWAIGLLIGLILSDLVARIITIMNETAYVAGDFLGDMVAGFIVGAMVGNLQWFLLKRHVPQARGWTQATIFGTLIGFLLARAFGSPVLAYSNCGPLFCFGFDLPPHWLPSPFGLVAYNLGGAVAGSIVGIALGLSQWLSLKQNKLLNGWWILTSAISLAVGFLIGFALSIVTQEVTFVAIAVGVFVAAASTIPFMKQLRRIDAHAPS